MREAEWRVMDSPSQEGDLPQPLSVHENDVSDSSFEYNLTGEAGACRAVRGRKAAKQQCRTMVLYAAPGARILGRMARGYPSLRRLAKTNDQYWGLKRVDRCAWWLIECV